MRHASRFSVALVLFAMTAAGLAFAGQWPYVMTFYDQAGNAVGWQVGQCDGSVSYFGQRTETYTIERLQCRD